MLSSLIKYTCDLARIFSAIEAAKLLLSYNKSHCEKKKLFLILKLSLKTNILYIIIYYYTQKYKKNGDNHTTIWTIIWWVVNKEGTNFSSIFKTT